MVNYNIIVSAAAEVLIMALRGCSQIKIIILNVIVTFGGEGGKPCDISNVNILKNISNCFFIVLQL